MSKTKTNGHQPANALTAPDPKPNFAPWMLQLREAVDNEIKDADMQAIVRTFVEKAKSGDERAAKFVIEYLMGGKFSPQHVTIENHYHQSSGAPVVVGLPSVESRIHTYLEAAGPKRASVIAADLDLPLAKVVEALGCDWFIEDDGLYRVATISDRRSGY